MALTRSAGILLHPTSLPGPGGIGTLGEHARDFVDTLQTAGIGLWQVLPLGPTGYGDSPYSALSAFAGNPFLIDLQPLLARGWITSPDLALLPHWSTPKVDFGHVVPTKMEILRRAFGRFEPRSMGGEFEQFCSRHAAWLDDFVLYMAIKDANGGAPWNEWTPALRRHDETAVAEVQERLSLDLQFHRFVQFVFFSQWEAVKQYANERGVRIVGDLPIFVAYDSSDVWANQSLFRLTQDGVPEIVAGVPPDYFSPTGQLWGNPHYRWGTMGNDGYAWWIERFRMAMAMVDIVRLDHFRGFSASWAVPYGDTTAERGEWIATPGYALFNSVQAALGDLPIIAEDLGFITPDVDDLRHRFGFPGMHILQFAFGSGPMNDSLPHNLDKNCAVYTGTHDNDTTIGWWLSIEEEERRTVRRYLGTSGFDISWDLIRLCLASPAKVAIVPLQDVLRTGTTTRMNLPGRAEGNWGWRFASEDISPLHVEWLRELVEAYGRAGRNRTKPASTA